jgi:hypothetical protein
MRSPVGIYGILVLSLLAGSCRKGHRPGGAKQEGSAKSMSTPREDSDSLLNAVMPFAQKMLTKNREFYPFGATMSTGGEISLVAGATGNEHPESAAVIDVIEKGFRESASSGKVRATALAIDVRITPPGKSTKQDAVEVRIDHRDNDSVRVIYPYSFSGSGEVLLEEPFAVPGDGRIFSK